MNITCFIIFTWFNHTLQYIGLFVSVKTHKEQNHSVLFAAKTPYQETRFRLDRTNVRTILSVPFCPIPFCPVTDRVHTSDSIVVSLTLT